MPRFASNLLFISQFGFIKKCVVDIDEGGRVVQIYSLEKEQESIIWKPGALLLFPADEVVYSNQGLIDYFADHNFKIRTTLSVEIKSSFHSLIACYPFDFDLLRPLPESICECLI